MQKDTYADIKKKSTRGSLLLLLTAFIWGVAFVAQSVGMKYVGPFTFTAVRNYIAVLILLPLLGFLDRSSGQTQDGPAASDTAFHILPASGRDRKRLLQAGILSGALLAAASCLQQIGIKYTTVGKAGFITAMYIILVPLLGIFLKKKPGVRLWISVGLAIAGLYLLCLAGGRVSLGAGDLLELCCAFFFALQIMAIDHYAPMVDGIRMAWLQFLVCAVLSTVPALIFEDISLTGLLAAWKPLLYAGALSSAVGYTLQIIAQKDTDPVVASLLMSLESSFSLLAGWVILGQKLSARELSGCGLMFLAIMLAQIPAKNRQKA